MGMIKIIIPIVVTVTGIVIDVIGQPKYWWWPIVVVPAGIVTEVWVWTVYFVIPETV